MEELKIKIDELLNDKQELENKVTDLSRHGRSPNDSDFYEMVDYLSNWVFIQKQLICLEGLKETIISNKKD